MRYTPRPGEGEEIPVSILGIERREETLWVALEPVKEEAFPPCIKNITARAGPGSGRHRALAVLASFLGQAGWDREEARRLWKDVAVRADIPDDIFDKWFCRMHCPRCDTVKEESRGYPRLGLAGLGFCEPDERCPRFDGPVQNAAGDADGCMMVVRSPLFARVFDWNACREGSVEISEEGKMELEALMGSQDGQGLVLTRSRIEGRLRPRFALKGGGPRRRVLSEML